jgi:protein O-mannosyl-transferase
MFNNSKQITLAVILIFIAFSPSIFAELSTVDDLDMYKWLSGPDPSFKDLFFPQAFEGTYYRPLIGVSYLFDKHIWFLDTRLMHLDNILFHITNALLIYYLAGLLMKQYGHQSSLLPLLSALLFGLHPITTESVAWISGRTDIMACTFVLLSTIFLLKFRNSYEIPLLLLSLIALIPGLLIKETPLAFLLGAIFILLARKDFNADTSPVSSFIEMESVRCAVFALVAATILLVSYNVWSVILISFMYLCYEAIRERLAGKPFRTINLLFIPIGILLPIGVFFLIRETVFVSNISSIGRTIHLIADDLNYALQTFFGAAGFYLKKFFFPFPLNFAIREIDPIYNAAGVVVFFICLYAIRRGSINGALFLSGICLFLPALPLSLGTVTWTGYAERYIYMSTAFWVLSTCMLWRDIFEKNISNSLIKICLLSLVLVMGVCTFQRSLVWKTNLSLLKDTVTKSPGFKLIRVDYMAALMAHSDFEEAKEQYLIAQSIPSVGYLETLDLNMALIHVIEGKYDEAEKLYEQVISKTKGKSLVAYEAYISYLLERYVLINQNQDGFDSLIFEKLVDNMERLYRLKKDPMLLYRLGQLFISGGNCDQALIFFREAGKVFPPESEYAVFSKKLVDKLASGRCRHKVL